MTVRPSEPKPGECQMSSKSNPNDRDATTANRDTNPDPIGERDYWAKNYNQRPYYETGYTYDDDYAPAYQHGWEGRARYGGKQFVEAEPTLRDEWDRTKGKSRLGWDKAKAAVRDAWDR